MINIRPGMDYYPNYITEEEEEKYLDENLHIWRDAGRTLGDRFIAGGPSFDAEFYIPWAFDFKVINHYQAGGELSAHIDGMNANDSVLHTTNISLMSDVVMTFGDTISFKNRFHVLLEARSAIHIYGRAASLAHKIDYIPDERISIIYRKYGK